MILRETTIDDLPGMRAITNYEIANNFAHFGTEPVSLAELTRDFEAAKNRYPWVVALDDTTPRPTVIGFAKAGPWKTRPAYAWSAEIGIYVAHTHHGCGVGKALYGELFPRLKAAGLRCIIAGIALPNAASVRLHESFGMTHVGTFVRNGYKHGAWRDVGYWQVVYGEAGEGP